MLHLCASEKLGISVNVSVINRQNGLSQQLQQMYLPNIDSTQ